MPETLTMILHEGECTVVCAENCAVFNAQEGDTIQTAVDGVKDELPTMPETPVVSFCPLHRVIRVML
jgi:hypothetical protein